MISIHRRISQILSPRIKSAQQFEAKFISRLPALFFLLAVAVISIDASAQDNPFPAAASVLQPQGYVSLQPVPRGHAFQVAVVAKISPGFHINAHQPSEDYLIPTKVTAELPAGLFVVETNYPRGVMRAFRFSKTPLRVYEGSFTVLMKLRANGSAPLGPQKINLTVGYQACNQDACLPPTKIPLTADLEIAAADTPAKPAHTDIFSSSSAEKSPPKP
ncbi:MAG TPA: protein-disulfide reductase DsbD domain-containing protein [Candidatus Acidoferrales bacterium]|jgi:thiol:disulfide interchange protein DsbD|nr:protein-disulfide reductase DsbD domain-containing protein [Candidatus Acidoferrales bacterium]